MLKCSNSKTKKIVIIILIVICICSVTSLSIIKFKGYKDKKEQEEISKLLTEIDIYENNKIDEKKKDKNEEDTKRMLQVSELKKENSEVVGWLEIEGTNISYPVCQGKDNDYYLTHTYKREYNINGSLFLDKDYDFSIPSSNLLIYGHSNKNGLMFDELIKYKDEAYYKQHPVIRFTTDKEDEKYEIMSAFKSRVYYKSETNVFRYYFFVNAKDANEYNEFVNNAKAASLYDTGVTAEYGDKLITLSTCDYERNNGRFAVIARKSK